MTRGSVCGGPREPLSPRPTQAAIDDVAAGLVERGQLLMACGTGKTLTALWATEALGAQRTLVLLPSLTLLSQTVTEWVANSAESFSFLVACRRNRRPRHGRSNDVHLRPAVPRHHRPSGHCRVLYRRRTEGGVLHLPVVLQVAAAQSGLVVPAFDLVIVDEAHRCAGRVSSDYSTVLDADLIRHRNGCS